MSCLANRVTERLVKTFVIVNPAAARGRGRRIWAELADALYDRLGVFEYEFTNAASAATVLAHQAVLQGYRRIIAVGGDGTVNEVLNGLFTPDGKPLSPDVVLGCLPAGSGTDFWKSLGLPERTTRAIKHLSGATTRLCDVGRVELSSPDGLPLVRYFCNVADVGLGGAVVDRAKKMPVLGRGFLNYFWSALASSWQWQAQAMEITIDGKRMPREYLVTALIANGAYCGGGMHIAPTAQLDSGAFELVRIRALTRFQLIAALPKLYTGTLCELPQVKTVRAKEITVTSSRPLPVTLDGEIAGIVPATFRVLPRTLRVLC